MKIPADDFATLLDCVRRAWELYRRGLFHAGDARRLKAEIGAMIDRWVRRPGDGAGNKKGE